ncbi:MAG: cytoplasmic protein [bacterium]|nr:cytoplasmic protein [bacterium]
MIIGSKKFNKKILIDAHKYTIYNREQIINDKKCGCFYCLEIFTPNQITEWIDNDQTALCPYCGVDSIIGEYSGYPITKLFLKSMMNYWF